MEPELQLTDSERSLVLELLEFERRELPSQIRRSDTTRFRKAMEERLHTVDELIDRLRVPGAQSLYR